MFKVNSISQGADPKNLNSADSSVKMYLYIQLSYVLYRIVLENEGFSFRLRYNEPAQKSSKL